jgi:hypothetical protein
LKTFFIYQHEVQFLDENVLTKECQNGRKNYSKKTTKNHENSPKNRKNAHVPQSPLLVGKQRPGVAHGHAAQARRCCQN